MNRNPQQRASRGFTLVELMITVAIVGILAAIAYPSYINYVRKSNRTDATRTMSSFAQALQRCYSQNFTYTTGCPTVAGTTTSPGGFYSIIIDNVTATGFRIRATPLGKQVNDTQCATFTILSSTQQTSTNSGGANSTQTCWGTM